MSPHLGQVGFLVCGPNDWLCLLFLTDFLLSSLQMATNSSAPPLRCWDMGTKHGRIPGLPRGAQAAGEGRGWGAICCARSPGPVLQRRGTARGHGATRAVTCRESHPFCETAWSQGDSAGDVTRFQACVEKEGRTNCPGWSPLDSWFYPLWLPGPSPTSPRCRCPGCSASVASVRPFPGSPRDTRHHAWLPGGPRTY